MIEKVIGDDLLTMEERIKLVRSIEDVIDDTKIIQEWMVIENNKLREKNVLETAREEGLEQGTYQGIKNATEKLILKMIERGDSYESISELTDKTIEEIKEIEKAKGI